ncbi:uncharacterized protein MYCFIDRAFT_180364 [Pseudocercospora fijiensis CIRAD86]|uniref:Uncharacterized protein n=1 Tax=Pseudocercospora fijiensis (strain CIRAD86) TaxID=383855 RepID=M3AIK0_PSEFD|nr:uncharacterized protein MYCFIDRAFT_180364 [Pseudocercospora fijiensis CIRAD86]EME77033.1 hypothetical protein MYCFIDRAFT_180364 [Pseudocercospora fijiensis CIRAD86]
MIPCMYSTLDLFRLRLDFGFSHLSIQTELLVKMVATGICHSDVFAGSAPKGTSPPFFGHISATALIWISRRYASSRARATTRSLTKRGHYGQHHQVNPISADCTLELFSIPEANGEQLDSRPWLHRQPGTSASFPTPHELEVNPPAAGRNDLSIEDVAAVRRRKRLGKDENYLASSSMTHCPHRCAARSRSMKDSPVNRHLEHDVHFHRRPFHDFGHRSLEGINLNPTASDTGHQPTTFIEKPSMSACYTFKISDKRAAAAASHPATHHRNGVMRISYLPGIPTISCAWQHSEHTRRKFDLKTCCNIAQDCCCDEATSCGTLRNSGEHSNDDTEDEIETDSGREMVEEDTSIMVETRHFQAEKEFIEKKGRGAVDGEDTGARLGSMRRAGSLAITPEYKIRRITVASVPVSRCHTPKSENEMRHERLTLTPTLTTRLTLTLTLSIAQTVSSGLILRDLSQLMRTTHLHSRQMNTNRPRPISMNDIQGSPPRASASASADPGSLHHKSLAVAPTRPAPSNLATRSSYGHQPETTMPILTSILTEPALKSCHQELLPITPTLPASLDLTFQLSDTHQPGRVTPAPISMLAEPGLKSCDQKLPSIPLTLLASSDLMIQLSTAHEPDMSTPALIPVLARPEANPFGLAAFASSTTDLHRITPAIVARVLQVPAREYQGKPPSAVDGMIGSLQPGMWVSASAVSAAISALNTVPSEYKVNEIGSVSAEDPQDAGEPPFMQFWQSSGDQYDASGLQRLVHSGGSFSQPHGAAYCTSCSSAPRIDYGTVALPSADLIYRLYDQTGMACMAMPDPEPAIALRCSSTATAYHRLGIANWAVRPQKQSDFNHSLYFAEHCITLDLVFRQAKRAGEMASTYFRNSEDDPEERTALHFSNLSDSADPCDDIDSAS